MWMARRVEGLKRAMGVAVGEKHSLALQRWCAAPLPLRAALAAPAEEAAAHVPGGCLERRASLASTLDEDDGACSSGGAGREADDNAAYWGSLEALQAAPPARCAGPCIVGAPACVQRHM